jgi:hypothetical protein
MSWVKEARTKLRNREIACVRPVGGSMRGRIESGQLVTIAPARICDIQPGDVVFVEWKRNYLLHLVVEVALEHVLIGNNVGKVNGWVPAPAVLGKVIAIENGSSETARSLS